MTKQIILAASMLVIGAVAGVVYAHSKVQPVRVCHATGSEKNPYVLIQVAPEALKGLDHAGDFIPAPDADDCSQPAPTPTPSPTSTPTTPGGPVI